MAAEQKDTIYIDVDDEITAIIDKVQSSTAKIVALVLPKRAVALQSIVNLKLLKRTAEESSKRLVLITSEAGLLPLAGAVGVYVAKSLQSKPEIPPEPDMSDKEEVAALGDEDVDGTKSVGELAGAAAVEDTVDIDDEPAKPTKAAAKSKGPKKDRKPKIPNFEKFRMKFFLAAGGVIALVLIWYFAVVMAGSAKIIVTTNTEAVNTTVEFTARPGANAVDAADKIVPATLEETTKEDKQTVAATGEKDVGEKATGEVNMTATKCSGNPFVAPNSVPAGTTITQNGKQYVTGEAATFQGTGASDGCYNYAATDEISITASERGSDYNATSATFSVSGRSDASASGSASGGTSKIIDVVSRQDVDNAKGKLDTSDDAVSSELEKKLQDQSLFAITDSFKASDKSIDVTPAVGQEASEVTVAYSATFSMVGINREDLKAILQESIKDQIDPDKQQIQEDGLDQATFTIKSVKADGTTVISVSTIVAVGPNIDTEQLKTDIAGKKKGETEEIIKTLPGVQEVSIDYSPFWINKTPNKPAKVTIEFEEGQ